MIVAILLVIVGVMFFSNHKLLEGSLQMQGVDLRGSGAHERANVLRGLATNQNVVKLAVSGVRQQNLSPGFLERGEDLVTMADQSHLEKGSLSFRMPTRDAADDKVRLMALLSAIWAESGAGNDAAASHRSQLAADQKRLEDFQQQKAGRDAELKALLEQLTAAGAAVKPSMDPGITIAEREADYHERQRDLNEAAALVKTRRDALADAQVQAAKADASAAQNIDRVRKNIADLNVRLEAIKLAQNGQADEAAKTFDAALDDFKQKLDAVPGDADADLLAYRSRAREAVADIRAANIRMSDREHQDAAAVAQLRSQIDDHREAHLTRVWASDPTLQKLNAERNAQAHRYATAVDSGLGDEAQKIKSALEDVDHKIEACRSALATGAPLSDDLQKSLQTAIDRMESDRLASEQQMSGKFKELQPPALESASAQQQKLAEELKTAVSALATTRQAYATASSLSASEAQDAARNIEAQITEQQARLDTLRQGTGNSNDPVQLAHAALTEAQGAEEKAVAAYASSHATLDLLRTYSDVRESALKLNEAAKAQADQVKATEEAVSATPTVLKPDDSSVRVVPEDDRRVNYLITGIGAVVVVFAALMWFSGAPQPAPITGFAVETLHDADDRGRGHDIHDAFTDDEHPIVA
jgi:hypothetical protein